MPRSKRERKVALSKTAKKPQTRDVKNKIIEQVHGLVDKYSNVYVLETENARNALMGEVREQYKDSKFLFGRSKVFRVALGVDVASEYADGLSEVGKHLVSQNCLLFTDRKPSVVREELELAKETTFARSGFIATEEHVLTEGTLENFTVSQESYLRQLGLPIAVEKGAIKLLADFTICKIGDKLTPERAKLLELNGLQMATFALKPVCHWSKTSGFELMN